MQEGNIREGDILGGEAESLRPQGTWQHLNLRQAEPTACSLQPKALTPTDNWQARRWGLEGSGRQAGVLPVEGACPLHSSLPKPYYNSWMP